MDLRLLSTDLELVKWSLDWMHRALLMRAVLLVVIAQVVIRNSASAGCSTGRIGGQNPTIERSFLDGTARSAIATTELSWPNGLAIDYGVQLVQAATHPIGSTQLGGYFYWTDWRSKSIERVDKATGMQRSVLREDKQTGRNHKYRIS